MKQTLLFRYRSGKSKSLLIGLTLLSFTAASQELPTDTLRTETISRNLSGKSGGIYTLNPEDLNKGLISSPEQLLIGQIPGLRVKPVGGQPGAESIMRLQALSSVFGRNEPLIVLDGMPLEKLDASGFTQFPGSLNPKDIASISFSKDAAGITVYGARAANGILYIATKTPQKGEKLKVTYSSTVAMSELRRKADVLSAVEFRKIVSNNFPDHTRLLGNATTDWQDVIYRKAFSHDHHLSLSGNFADVIPFRLSAGHLNQQGILKNTDNKRNNVAVSLNPSMLQDHLKLNVNLRAADQTTHLAHPRAIVSAWDFDPTQPVYAENEYGGYYLHRDNEGNVLTYATRNPLSLLEQFKTEDQKRTLQGQAHLQYSVHGLEGLQVNLRYGITDIRDEIYDGATTAAPIPYYGNNVDAFATRKTKFREATLGYDHPNNILYSKISLLVGGSYYDSKIREKVHSEAYKGDSYSTRGSGYMSGSTSLFGKLSVLHKEKYTLHATLAQDQDSHLPSSDNKSLSYSFGTNWDVLKEEFMAGKSFFSSLHLYANYLHFVNRKLQRTVNALTLIDPRAKGEIITRINLGSKFSIFNDKLQGNLSLAYAGTKDMFLLVPASYNTGYDYFILNAGKMKNLGFEGSMNYNVLEKNEFNWSLGANISYNKNEVKELAKGMNVNFYDQYGDLGRRNLIGFSKGYPVNSFGLREHVLDSNGKPIENTFVKNTEGRDSYIFKHSADPVATFGLNSLLVYKSLDFGFMLRGNLGNYVYQEAVSWQSDLGNLASTHYLSNLSGTYLEDDFRYPQTYSHHYLQNASFLRMEYLQLGYNFENIANTKANIRLTGTVQNAFVLTKYKGQDPEVASGVDNGQYPIPRTYSLGLIVEI